MFIAHGRKSEHQQQLLRDHLIESAELSQGFGKKLQLEHTCYLAGLLHDFGKYSDDFQHYLSAAIVDPKAVVRGSVDHSTAGGKLLYEYSHQKNSNPFQKLLAEIVGNAIISHHSSRGLQDFYQSEEARSIYLERVVEKKLPEYTMMKERFFAEVLSEAHFKERLYLATQEVEQFCCNVKETTAYFYVMKFVYSCLLDADRTNTMLFEEKRSEEPSETHHLLKNYQWQLEDYVTHLKKSVQHTPINQLRTALSEQCKNFATQKEGIYSLSIPTGGGKTLSSLRFALTHAVKHKKDRIIYVVPYTTIIEQNAQVIRKILHDDAPILEHHSNVFDEEKQESNDETEVLACSQERMKDNWDAPIIFTTIVQFLNVIYGQGTRNPRRFHNLQHAILIFDEVQAVPPKCMHLFTEALNFLKSYGKTTSILCTATQPSLDKLPKELKKDEEMIQDLSTIEHAFKRVELVNQIKKEEWTLSDLVDLTRTVIREKNSILIVLNTKTAVLNLYQQLTEVLSDAVQLVHLSTAMCPAHRKEKLNKLTKQLAEKRTERKIICITTQLIEAGVDISFEAVIRSTAGLDSLAQAAGRCNRNGEAEKQAVHLVNMSSKVENLTHLKEITAGKEITARMLKDMSIDLMLYGEELLSTAAQTAYFDRFYAHEAISKTLDYPVERKSFTLYALLNNRKNARRAYYATYAQELDLLLYSSPQTIGRYFQVIDSPTTAVLVPYKEQGAEMIAKLNSELSSQEGDATMKAAQQYTVTLFDYELKILNQNKAILPLYNGAMLALTENAYSDQFGVDLTAFAASEGLIF